MRHHSLLGFARIAGVALLLGATASCTSNTSQTDTTGENTGDMSTTQPTSVAVSHVELGTNVDTEKRVTEQSREFRPGDTIYASVLTSGSAPSTEIKARWMTEDGQVVEESTQTITPTGSDATEFHISNPTGMPAGRYRLEIFLNGQSAGTQEFEIRAA